MAHMPLDTDNYSPLGNGVIDGIDKYFCTLKLKNVCYPDSCELYINPHLNSKEGTLRR